MTRSNYLIKDYEHKVNGRVLCKEHGLLRCSECACVDDLEKQNKRYREALEFYADKDNHMIDIEVLTIDGIEQSSITIDYGRKARNVLEESE